MRKLYASYAIPGKTPIVLERIDGAYKTTISPWFEAWDMIEEEAIQRVINLSIIERREISDQSAIQQWTDWPL